MRLKVFPYVIVGNVKSAMTSFLRDAPDHHLNPDGLKAATTAARLAWDRVKANPTGIRDQLARKLLLPESLVNIRRDISGDGTENSEISAVFYGIRIKGILYKGAERLDCLIVYNQGHGGDFRDFAYFKTLRDELLGKGCDVLATSMLGLGINSGPISFPANVFGQDTVLELSPQNAKQHVNTSFFFSRLNPKASPLSLFLTGHAHIINSLSSEYDRIGMIGISGGGWETTLLSALLPEIDFSVAVAGSLPLMFRFASGDLGDYEQAADVFWRNNDYWQFYFLGLFNGFGEMSRDVHLMYNSGDPCCFRNPVDFLEVTNDFDALKVHIVENNRHSIHVPVALDIFDSFISDRPQY